MEYLPFCRLKICTSNLFRIDKFADNDQLINQEEEAIDDSESDSEDFSFFDVEKEVDLDKLKVRSISSL